MEHPKDTLRVGVIGTGVMGADHAHNLARGVRGASLAAVADADVGRAKTLAAEVGADQVFADGTEMIGSGAVDAVIIAVPDPFHADLIHAALDAGLPVLCEKPLTPWRRPSASSGSTTP